MVFPFERLRDRLLVAGVSPRHVRRYMAELADHFDDLEAEAKSAGNSRPKEHAIQRLGSPDDLAQAMIARTEKAWTARAPWAVFLFGPPLLLALIDALSIALMISVVKTAGYQSGLAAAPGWIVALAASINLIQRYAVPLFLGWIVTIVATRQRMKSLWPLAGLIAIGIIAGINYLHIEVPLAPGQHGEISFGGSVGPETAFRVAVNLILTLPLYFAWRRWRPAFANG